MCLRSSGPELSSPKTLGLLDIGRRVRRSADYRDLADYIKTPWSLLLLIFLSDACQKPHSRSLCNTRCCGAFRETNIATCWLGVWCFWYSGMSSLMTFQILRLTECWMHLGSVCWCVNSFERPVRCRSPGTCLSLTELQRAN